MRKVKLSIVMIVAILFSSVSFAQEKNESKEGEIVIANYSGKILWRDLGQLINEDLTSRLDSAMMNGDCAELIRIGVELEFYEEALGSKSEVITSEEIAKHLVYFMSRGVNSESALNLGIKYAEKIGDKNAAGDLKNIKAEYESAGFSEDQVCYGTLYVNNNSGWKVKYIIPGVESGWINVNSYRYINVPYGDWKVEYYNYFNGKYIGTAYTYVPCGGSGNVWP